MNRRTFLSASLVAPAALTLALKAEDGPTVKLPPVKVPVRTPAVDFDVLLWAIAEKETHNDDTKVGPRGERSKYQITRAVWDQHLLFWKGANGDLIALFFEKDCRGKVATRKAADHLCWLDENLPHETTTEVHFRPYALAFAWNAGLTAWLTAGRDRSQRHETKNVGPYAFAGHVHSLYEDRRRTA